MVRGIGDRVKINQIIESQLPEFIKDNISIVESDTISSNSFTASYSRSEKTIIISSPNHNLSEQQRINIEVLSGSASEGFYGVYKVLDNNTFTVLDGISGFTSGTLSYTTYQGFNSPETREILSEPGSYDKFIEFLRQYYISQEYPSSSIDIIDNLDQYLSLDNFLPESLTNNTILTSDVSASADTIFVSSTKGFPEKYGLLKIGNEIITYLSKNSISFLGCVRGFSGITNYHDPLNPEELVFSVSDASSHNSGDNVENLSNLFLREFFRKVKYSLSPGLENKEFVSGLNIGNFLKESRSFYESKGTEESFKILFRVLYGSEASIIDLEQYLIKPSSARYIRREVSVVEALSGNPANIIGQTVYKQNDSEVSASISKVEPFTVGQKTYYTLYLFVGYDDASSSITGKFNVTPSTLCSSNVSISTTSNEVVNVDSTVGFSDSGYFIYDGEIIFFNEKTLNQFLGCRSKNSTVTLEKAKSIISSDIYYSYENGDLSKKVEMRFTGIVDGLNINLDYDDPAEKFNYISGDEIFVKNLGKVIKNPEEFPSDDEIFANSWIYNTNCRFQIDRELVNGQELYTFTDIDKSNLKVGDYIEILERDTQLVVPGLELVKVVDVGNRRVDTDTDIETTILSVENKGLTVITEDYDFRRIQKTAFTNSLSSIKYGNNKLISNILNVYQDEYNGSFYVASNSLPDYEIEANVYKYDIDSLPLSGYNSDTELYSIIKFDRPVSFLDGDRVSYITTGESIVGLSTEEYYFVKVISSDRTQVNLFSSPSSINSGDPIEIGEILSGTHSIVLYSQRTLEIESQKLLRKFTLNQSDNSINRYETDPGPIGLLVDGVEIFGYKTNDKVYYGPIESVNVLNSGTGYDVINPPLLEFSAGISSESAKIQPVVSGSFTKVLVSRQEFDIGEDIRINVSGGNGSGVILEPVLKTYQREVNFDARTISNGGGIDNSLETISFLIPHSFYEGQEVIYDSNNNSPVGISDYQATNADSGKTLVTDSSYFVSIINDRTIILYPTFSDYSAGINTIGITTVGNGGVHKFKTLPVNTLSEIVVVDGGSGYTNRKLRVKPSGISTNFYSINFKNHGFSDGEIVEYKIEDTDSISASPITGLSTNNSYYIVKIDDESFHLCDAGIGATISENYERGKIVKITGVGSGYHVFKYPDISLNISYSIPGIGTTSSFGNIDAIPIVNGEITDVYVYENGSGYGSDILNLKINPKINIKNGSSAQFKPIISSGSIIDVQVQYGGVDYYSYPELKVISSSGNGAILKPIIQNGAIVDVEILNGGKNYLPDNTSVIAVSAGINAKFISNIRALTVNNVYKFGTYEETLVPNVFYRKPSDEIVASIPNKTLQYAITSYSSKISERYGDVVPTQHSPIIGWAYDGNPIYGPYGYSDPFDNSSVKKMTPGYVLTDVFDRPSGYESGFFIEDYMFNDSGDLDLYNGRFCKTPEFPSGTYAYFATIENDLYSNSDIGKFPYFIGEYYRSDFEKENLLQITQSYDFENSNLIRNTLPYKVNDEYAGNDFIVESNEIVKQRLLVESTKKGNVDKFKIIDGGSGYKVGDRVIFEDPSSNVIAKVSEIKGKEILSLNTTQNLYEDSILTWENDETIKVTILPTHDIEFGDTVVLSGLSTDLFRISNSYLVGITTYVTKLTKPLSNASTTGIVTTIGLSYIPPNVSVGSSIKIENEIVSVLNVYSDKKALKILRPSSGLAHADIETINVEVLSNSFTINKSVEKFISKINEKYYFNPTESVGLGTTSGITRRLNYYIDDSLYQADIPTQSIFLPKHNFKTNQKVKFVKPSSTAALTVTKDGVNFFTLPESGNEQTLYVINQSIDHIGLVTSVGLTTSSNGLFFTSSGSNNSEYYIETDFVQEKCDVERFKVQLTTKTPHNLSEGDKVVLSVKPNGTGIGSTSILVKYDNINKLLLLDEVNISSGINVSSSSVTIPDHNLVNGQRIYYRSSNSVAGGLTTGYYYILKLDDDTFKLAETYNDTINDVPRTIKLTSSGGSGQTISKINPKISVVRNKDIIFDLSHSSLSGYEFKLFYDNQYYREFKTIETENDYSLIGFGTPGVTAGANLILKYSDNLPEKLFYNISKSGFINTSDISTIDYTEISYDNSVYTGEFNSYNTYGVGSTTFNISLNKKPESLSYTKNDCDVLEYYTNSTKSEGEIYRIKILSKGNDIEKIPNFSGFTSTSSGVGAYIIPISNDIGNPSQIKIFTNGFDYPSDKTIRPSASIPTVVTIKNNKIIKSIDVIDGGNKYLSPPTLIALDSTTNEVIDTGILRAELSGLSIGYVNVEISPKRLPSTPISIKAIDNTNGISISEVQSSSSGIVTCILTTPILGFSTDPFKFGDKIFVEGIQKNSTDGDGFNSSDYNYQFFDVLSYDIGSNPGKLTYSLSGLTTNPGIAKTIQGSFATIINSIDYPSFTVNQEFARFNVGESLSSDKGFGFEKRDLIVKQFSDNSIRVFGTYTLSNGEILKGDESLSEAIVDSLKTSSGTFIINAYSSRNIGWENEVGKLSEDFQVIEDNDYYQNLSYSIKSDRGWDQIVSTVNDLLHTSGLKNFADTQFITSVKANPYSGISSALDSNLLLLSDNISERRVDIINNFDLSVDVDILIN